MLPGMTGCTLNSPHISPNNPNLITQRSANAFLESAYSELDEPKDPETALAEEQAESKLIDDVYDVNAVKPNYELQSLRKDWVLDYMQLMEIN